MSLSRKGRGNLPQRRTSNQQKNKKKGGPGAALLGLLLCDYFWLKRCTHSTM